MADYRTDVAIAGAGLAGRTLTSLLCRNGIRCLLIDTGGKPAVVTDRISDPRALAITPASANILASINIWQRLPHDQIGHFSRMQVWDQHSGGRIDFDSADIGETLLGYIVAQAALQDQLEQACNFLPDCTVISQARVSALTELADGISLQLNQGDRIGARLLVAADGSNSPIRQLAGLDYQRHDYRQQAIACVVKTSLPHANVARQRFLSSGPLAFLPLADRHQCGIVWSTDTDHAHELLDSSETEFCMHLQQAFEHCLGEVLTAGPRSSFELFSAQAPAYVAGRVVLTGDAAHTVHPLAGQGANLGLLDVAVLAELILEAKSRGRDWSSRRVLRNYERWRKTDNLRMQLVLDLLKRLFESDQALVVRARGLGLDTLNSITWIKSTIMQHAMGLEGDLPACARRPLYAEMI